VELREPAVSAPSGGRGVSSGPVEDTGGPGVSKRPARASTARKGRSTTNPPAAAEKGPQERPAAVKASKPKAAPRRTTSKTTPKPTKPKEPGNG